MNTLPKIWIIDVQKEITNWMKANNVQNTTEAILSINKSDLARIGNYKPIIVSSPQPLAMQLAGAFSQRLNVKIITSYLLLTDEEGAISRRQEIWNSLDDAITNSYRVAIFIAES
jgi:hypothetical protein